MSSLLTSDVAAQASIVNGETTGAVSRCQFDQQNTLSQSELNAVASGTSFSGGKKSKRKGKKTARRSKRRVRIFTRKGKSYLRRPAR